MTSVNTARTCPECNSKVVSSRCTNKDCNYRGPGWTDEQLKYAWSQVGETERTVGAMYDYTGRD